MGIPTASPDCWKDASELIAYKDPTQNRLNKYKIQFLRILTSQIWDESVNSQRQSWDPSLYFFNNSFPLKILHPLLEERKKAECGNIYCNKYSKMLTAFTSPILKCLCLLSFNAQTLPTQWVTQHNKHNLWAHSPGPQLTGEQWLWPTQCDLG